MCVNSRPKADPSVQCEVLPTFSRLSSGRNSRETRLRKGSRRLPHPCPVPIHTQLSPRARRHSRCLPRAFPGLAQRFYLEGRPEGRPHRRTLFSRTQLARLREWVSATWALRRRAATRDSSREAPRVLPCLHAPLASELAWRGCWGPGGHPVRRSEHARAPSACQSFESGQPTILASLPAITTLRLAGITRARWGLGGGQGQEPGQGERRRAIECHVGTGNKSLRHGFP